MRRYTKREYEKYVRVLEKDNERVVEKYGEKARMNPISFEKWKALQPVADKAIGEVDKLLK